jgi:hypothetical protein
MSGRTFCVRKCGELPPPVNYSRNCRNFDFNLTPQQSLPIALLLWPIFDRAWNRIFVIRMKRAVYAFPFYENHLHILCGGYVL